jgi:hypothetical protein
MCIIVHGGDTATDLGDHGLITIILAIITVGITIIPPIITDTTLTTTLLITTITTVITATNLQVLFTVNLKEDAEV